MSPERKLDRSIAQWAIQALARWTLTVAVALGVLIILGGDARFAAPSYVTALRYPYAPESWGVVVLLAGLVGIVASLFGRLKIVACALYLMTAWCLFFAHSFLQTASENPMAGTTGPVIYGGVAVVSALLGVVHWKSASI